mgnify:CR=1 FL=1
MNDEPPYDHDAEIGALGAMLIDHEAATIAAAELRTTDFYHHPHRALFAIMCDMLADGQALDELTVVAEATQRQQLDACGGRDTIGRLIVKCPSAANVEGYCGVLKSLSEQRAMQDLAVRLRRMQDINTPTDEQLDMLHSEIARIEHWRLGGLAESFDLHGLAVPVAADALSGETRDTWGLATGIAGNALDERLGGMQAGTYVVLAGRASMGKSTFAYAIALGVRRLNPAAGVPLIVSNEMLPDAVARTSLASVAGIHPSLLLSRKLGSEQQARVRDVIGRRLLQGVSVVHLAGGTVPEVAALAAAHQRTHGLPLLVIDLAGRLHAPGESEYLQLKNVSRGLQALAGKLKTCIVACVQVSRNAMMNTDKRPDLKDLKGCGSWEEDADHVIFLHRPAYYGGKDRRTEVVLAKDRITGNVGTTWIQYDRNTGQYVPAEADDANGGY